MSKQIDLQDFLPSLYSVYDPDQVLQKFFEVVTSIFNGLVTNLDEYPKAVTDPATSAFIQELLEDSGNPFWFSLSDLQKRELLVNLLELYNQRGTESGCLRAVRLIMKHELLMCSFLETPWTLGRCRLGVDTVLNGPNAGVSYWVGVPSSFTADQTSQLQAILAFMAPGHIKFYYMDEAELEAMLQPAALNALVTFDRASTGYDLAGSPLQVNEAAREPVVLSSSAFSLLPTLATPFDDTTQVWDYATTVAKCKELAQLYPASIVYEDMSRVANAEVLLSGREQSALKILDNGTKPTLVFHTAIHGNERHSIRGIYRLIQEVMTSNVPLFQWIRSNMAIHWLVLPNPDGAYWNKRGLGDWADNVNDHNGNREYPYFWDRAIDPGKGPSVLADLEIRNVVNWMTDKVSRALIVCDVHMWFSQTIYGWLTDHVWRNPLCQSLNSAIYNYTNALLQQRDYGTLTMVHSKSNMRLSYRSKAFKPYFEAWCAVRMRSDGFAFQVEQPQSENQGLNATMTLDLGTAIFQAAQDAMLGTRSGVHLAPAVAPADVLNNNSDLVLWHSTEPRPQYMTLAGLNAQQDTTEGSTVGTRQLNLYRPASAAWPIEGTITAGCLVDTGDTATSFMAVVGGSCTPGPVASTKGYIEYLEPPAPPAPGSSASSVYVPTVLQKSLPNLPVAMENHALCTDGTYLYAVGGYNGTYLATIYRIAIADILNNSWSLWHTLTTYTGIQQHTAHCYNGKLYIIGGRDSVGYKNTMLEVDLTSKAETIWATLTTHYSSGFGWHNSVLVGSDLYVIGGWGGSTARTNVTKVNMTNAAQTAMTALPYARRQAQGAYRSDNGGEIWLLSGKGTTDYSETIYCYKISDNAWTGFLADSGYTIEMPDSEGMEDGDVVSRPTFFRAGGVGFYNPVTGTFLAVMGETETGTPTSSVWEFDPESYSAHQRSTQDMLWGYMGPSTSPSVAPGKQVSFVSVVRNAHSLEDLTIQPVVRPVVYVDPYGTPRKMFHKHFVPGRGSNSVAMHADLEARNYGSNQQVRARLRLYGGGTKIQAKWLQLTQTPFLAVPVDPAQGKAVDTLTATFAHTLKASNAQHYDLCLMPRWGSQLVGDFTVWSATCVPGSLLQTLELKWVSQPNISAADWTPDEVCTGKFQVHTVINGVSATVDLATDIRLNHDRYTPFNRREQVYVRLMGTGQGLVLSLWHYGKTWSHTIAESTAEISALVVPGTGLAVTEADTANSSVADPFYPVAPSWGIIDHSFAVTLADPELGALYEWAIYGGTAVVAQNTQSAVVTPTAAGACEIQVTQQGGTLTGRKVSVYTQILDHIFSGLSVSPGDMPAGQRVVVAVNNPSAADINYQWTVEGGYILSGQGTSEAVLITGLAGNICTLQVQAKPTSGLDVTQTSSVSFTLLPFPSSASVTATNLAAGATQTGSITLGHVIELERIVASSQCRFRLYDTAAHRNADLSRAVGVVISGSNHGEITEVTPGTGGGLDVVLDPHADGTNADTPQTALFYYSLTNMDTVAQDITVTLHLTKEG